MGDDRNFYTIDKGLAGGAPDAPATYVGMCHIYVDTVAAFGKHGPALIADLPNFTDANPVIR